MTDVELSMLQCGSSINSARMAAEIHDVIERRRAEQVALQRDAHATNEAAFKIIRKMDEAAESSRIALEISQKSLKFNKRTFWIAVATLVVSIVGVLVAVIVAIVKG